MTDIVDCIIDGGGANQIPCPTTATDECTNDPSKSANAWAPQTILKISAETKSVSERFTAVEGQVLFDIKTFAYFKDTGALEVHKNGLLLTPQIDWVEQTSTTFALVQPATANDVLVATAHVAISGNVDVRDTDIFISNYQALRDYTGTEITIYTQGRVTAADGGEGMFQLLTGFAIGFFTDNNYNILVPTAGDGSSAWLSKSTLDFNTIDDLEASVRVKVGDIVTTFGYIVLGDAGSNKYEIVAAGTATPNEGSVIDLPGSGFQAIALFGVAPVNFNSRQWGVVADGVTDDTVQMDRALDFLSSVGGGELLLPITEGGSVYKCNVILHQNTNITGASRDVTMIPAIDAPVITVAKNEAINRLSIKLIVIEGAATKATFTSQDGIRIEPDVGIVHDKINIEDCIIKNCGAAGIVYKGADSTREVREPTIIRSTVKDCARPGLEILGEVSRLDAANCTINDNGDENIDTESNIVIQAFGGSFPEDINLGGTRIETPTYLVSGNSIYASSVLGLSVLGCTFIDFKTGILFDTGPNGQILIANNRFERETGVIVALCEIDDVNGFTWSNNNVGSTTAGPIGINLTGTVENLTKIDITANNSWGNLTASVNNMPPAIVTSNAVSLPQKEGLVAISLSGAGLVDLNNVFDEKGGIVQLVNGDEVTLHITDITRAVTVKDAVGNIDSVGDFLLNGLNDNIKLAWNSYTSKWIETSRSNN